MDDKEKAHYSFFLEEYKELCIRHQLCLNGCGCCGSPFVSELTHEGELTWTGDYENVLFS